MAVTPRLIATSLIVLLLGACGDEGATPDSSATAADDSTSPIEFRVHGNAPPGTPWEAQWSRFEQALNDGDHGLQPTLFVTGQLGDPDAAMSATRRGRIQVGGFPLAGAATVIPELNVLLIPYLFESEDEVDFILDNYLLDAFQQLFAAKNLVLLQWVDAGWNQLYARQPLRLPAELAGKPMRAQRTIASQTFFEKLGADTIPLAFSETLPSLQTGLIEGGESVAPIYLAVGLIGEAPYLISTQHSYDSGVVVANKRWFDGLSQTQQQALRQAMGKPQALRQEVRAMVKAMTEQAIAQQRLTVIELDEPGRQQWRSATLPHRVAILDQIGGQAAEILSAIETGKQAFAAQ